MPSHPQPMPRPGGPGHPRASAEMTVEELEAAAAALPGKRDALREAFDRLAACSPAPLPFAWVDLDAHVSSLQSSISLRVRQVRALEAARAAPAAAAPVETRGDGTGGNLEEEEEVYEEEEEVLQVEEVEEEEEDVFEVQEEVEEEVLEVEFVEQEDEEKADEETQEVLEVEEVEEEEEDVFEVQEEVEEEVLEVEFVEQEDEEKADEEMQEGDNSEANIEIGNDGKDEEEARDDRIGNGMKDDMEAKGENQDADGGMRVANEVEQSSEDGNRASLDSEEDANMEEAYSTKDGKNGYQGAVEDTNMAVEHGTNMEVEHGTNMEEAVMKKASAMQGNKEEACGMNQEEEEQEAHKEEGAKNVTTEATPVAKEVSQDQGNQSLPGGFSDHAAACATMDAQRLVKLLFTNTGLNSEFQAALHGAPDAAALALHIVELFLHDKILKTTKAWVNCVGLIRMVPVIVTELSADTVEQAKLVAKNWKEMIDNSECCTVLGSLAPWGFLYFLISYNIVSEFETKEIFRLFGTMPRKQQRMNYAMLFKGLRLTDRIPELMDYLIKNGQQMDALYWARAYNLVDKYTPASLLKGYVEKAKQTAIEISQNNMTLLSRSAIIKELDNLRRAQDLEQQITDSSISTSIGAEIKDLLVEFEKKKLSLTKSAKKKKRSLAKSASTSNSQQQHNKKHKKEQDHREGQGQQQGQLSKPGEKLEEKLGKQEHHEGQESEQQGQQSKPGEKLEEKIDKQQRHKGQESQQQGQQSKPGEKLEEKIGKQEHHEGQESQQQGQLSKPGEKLEEKLDKQELHEGQENQQQGLQSKPGVKLEQKLDKPQQRQQQKKQDKLQGKQQQSNKQHVRWPRQHTPKLPAPRGNFGHPPYAAIHGVYHSYPAQAGWSGVPCVPPFAPQLGAPEYIIPFNPLYPHPEYYPW